MALGRRTQVKIGLTVASPCPFGCALCDVDAAGDAADFPANDLAIAHQLDAGRVPTWIGARLVSSK
jgi:hypothetical protein